MRKNLIRNIGISVGIFTLAIAGSRILQILDVQKYSTTVFIFAVFLISLCTDGYVYGVLSAFAGMLMVNYALHIRFLQWVHCYRECDFSVYYDHHCYTYRNVDH